VYLYVSLLFEILFLFYRHLPNYFRVYFEKSRGGERRTLTFNKYQSFVFIMKSNIYMFKSFYRRNHQAENNV